MITGSVSCLLLGDELNSKKLEDQSTLLWDSITHKGEVATDGRFKGKKNSYSSAHFSIESNLNTSLNDAFNETLNDIKENDALFKEVGVTQRILTLNIGYTGQCNWEFSKKQLQDLVDLDISFSFSCYQEL